MPPSFSLRLPYEGHACIGKSHLNSHMKMLSRSTIITNQNNIIGREKYHFFGFPSSHIPSACARHCSKTSLGINLTVNATSAGKRITSSRYPRTGIKSGTRSMGDKAYATVIAANTLAYQGVFLSFKARNTAGISDFSRLALSFKLIIHPYISGAKSLKKS